MKAIPSFDQAMRDVRRLTAAARRMECRAYHLWDGFDDYDGSHEVWTTVGGTPTYSTAYARFPAAPNCAGKGIRFPGGTSARKTWNMVSSQSRMLFSFAVYFENFPASNYTQFLEFSNSGNVECCLAVSSAGALALMNATSFTTVLAGSGPGVVSPGNWYFIDVDVTISGSVGAITVHLNTPLGGAALFSATGLNNLGFSGIASMNQFVIGDVGNNISIRFDDFHAQDPTGSAPNTILGEGSRIYTKLPNGAGYATTLTPNGASANWQCVDDNPPDDDTTYNSAASFPRPKAMPSEPRVSLAW